MKRSRVLRAHVPVTSWNAPEEVDPVAPARGHPVLVIHAVACPSHVLGRDHRAVASDEAAGCMP